MLELFLDPPPMLKNTIFLNPSLRNHFVVASTAYENNNFHFQISYSFYTELTLEITRVAKMTTSVRKSHFTLKKIAIFKSGYRFLVNISL